MDSNSCLLFKASCFVLAMCNIRNNFNFPNFQAAKDTLNSFGILRIHSYLHLMLVDVKHLLKDICSAKSKGWLGTLCSLAVP
jgi:hypothetical protein